MRGDFQDSLYSAFSERSGDIPFGADYEDLKEYKQLTLKCFSITQEIKIKNETLAASQKFFSTAHLELQTQLPLVVQQLTQAHLAIAEKLSTIKNKYATQFGQLLCRELANIQSTRTSLTVNDEIAAQNAETIQFLDGVITALQKQLADLNIITTDTTDNNITTFVETWHQKYRVTVPQVAQKPDGFFQFLLTETELFFVNNTTNHTSECQYTVGNVLPSTGLVSIRTPSQLTDQYEESRYIREYLAVLNFHTSHHIIDINDSLTKFLERTNGRTGNLVLGIRKTATGFLVQNTASPTNIKMTVIDRVVFQVEETGMLHLLSYDELRQLHAAYIAKKDKVVLVQYEETIQHTMPVHLIFQLLDEYGKNDSFAHKVRELLQKLMMPISPLNDPTTEITAIFDIMNRLLCEHRPIDFSMPTEMQFLEIIVQGLLLCAIELGYSNYDMNGLRKNMGLLTPLDPDNADTSSNSSSVPAHMQINSFCTGVDNATSHSGSARSNKSDTSHVSTPSRRTSQSDEHSVHSNRSDTSAPIGRTSLIRQRRRLFLPSDFENTNGVFNPTELQPLSVDLHHKDPKYHTCFFQASNQNMSAAAGTQAQHSDTYGLVSSSAS